MQKINVLLFLLLPFSILNAQKPFPITKNQSTIDSLKKIPLRVLAADYYSNNLPFFCRKELQIQRVIKVPFKFRIGSVEEVDKLEGKHLVRP